MTDWEQQAKDIVADPAASYSLKRALHEFTMKDPVDAVNEVEVLLQVLTARMDEVFLKNSPSA